MASTPTHRSPLYYSGSAAESDGAGGVSTPHWPGREVSHDNIISKEKGKNILEFMDTAT